MLGAAGARRRRSFLRLSSSVPVIPPPAPEKQPPTSLVVSRVGDRTAVMTTARRENGKDGVGDEKECRVESTEFPLDRDGRNENKLSSSSSVSSSSLSVSHLSVPRRRRPLLLLSKSSHPPSVSRADCAPSVLSLDSSSLPGPSETTHEHQSSLSTNGVSVGSNAACFTILYTKQSKKKHKSYDDGFVVVREKKMQLFSSEGKKLSETLVSGKNVSWKEGDEMYIGNYEGEICTRQPIEEFLSGRLFLNLKSIESKQNIIVNTVSAAARGGSGTLRRSASQSSPGSSKYTPSCEGLSSRREVPSDALILNGPDNQLSVMALSSSEQVQPVFVESFLTKSLRPHQRDGIMFMFNCISGFSRSGMGCILADSMGLGKTLQTIALLWTLLNQGFHDSPMVKKALIVTPASLVHNWAREIQKWLGTARLKPIVISGHKKAQAEDLIKQWMHGYSSTLIVSYEIQRSFAKLFASAKCDLVICDEGHRLKNPSSSTFRALNSLRTRRRIILTGTPIQNNLEELFACVAFTSPDLFESKASFTKVFADPITKGRDSSASASEKLLGELRANELLALVSDIMIRRTNEIMENLLPPKHEIIVFVRLTPTQESIYRAIISTKKMRGLFQSADQTLAFLYITLLQKLCNEPSLLYTNSIGYCDSSLQNPLGVSSCVHPVPSLLESESGSSFANEEADVPECSEILAEALRESGRDLHPLDVVSLAEYSVKLCVVSDLLRRIRDETSDKIVLISMSTKVLDVLEVLCKHLSLSTCRLDGSTAADRRHSIVERFNNPRSLDLRVFLLSTLAGGVGLNLIGGNRLILFDLSWNPSHDTQAMARIWREGQKKPCFIYRFLCDGTIEEKKLQRQLEKEKLSNFIIRGDDGTRDSRKSSTSSFSRDELRKIFQFQPGHLTFSQEECEDFQSEKSKKALLDQFDESKISFFKILDAGGLFPDPCTIDIAIESTSAESDIESAEEDSDFCTTNDDEAVKEIESEEDEEYPLAFGLNEEDRKSGERHRVEARALRKRLNGEEGTEDELDLLLAVDEFQDRENAVPYKRQKSSKDHVIC